MKKKAKVNPFRRMIEENPFLSIVVAMGVMFGATKSISGGVEVVDSYFCTEAEAQDMIEQQTIPMHRDEIDFQIKQLKYQIYILEQKEINGKSEPWEPKLLEDLEDDLNALKEKKAALPR